MKGIIGTTFYKWYNRYKSEGVEGLYERPKTPKNKRKPTLRKYILSIRRRIDKDNRRGVVVNRRT